MVLSLRAPSTPDPIQVAFEKFAEKFTASMKTWTDQFVEAMKQTRSKSEPVHDRRVLICGYTQGEDCICVSTETMESEYDDLNEAAVVLEEENGFQNQLQTQSDDDLVVQKVGDHEGLLATLEDPSPPIHLTCHQLIDDVCKVFDKSPERKLDTNKEFSGKELLRMVHPRESEYHYSPKSTLLTLEDSTTGNVKLINVSQASHIVKDANYQSIKECSHVLVNEFVNELSPEPPDKYVTKGDLSLTGSTITSDEVENLYNKDIEGATVSQVFDKIQTRNMDKNSPRFEENGNDVFLPLYILASVDSFEQICISQINHDMGIEGLNVENQLIDKYHGYITEPNIELPDDNGQIIHVGATKPKLSPKNVTHINIIGVYEERGMQQLSAFRFCKVLMDAALEVFEDMSQQDDLILSQSSKLFMAGPVENDKVTFLNTSIPASELPNLILKDNKQLEMLKAYNAVGIKRVDNVFDEWSVFIFCNKNETCLCVLLNNNSGCKIDGFYMHVEREQTIEGLECYEMESETGREEKNLLNKTLTKPKQNNKMEIDSKTVEAAGSSMQMDSEESLKDKAKVDIRESIEKLTMDKTTFKKKPIIIIMMGMAGSGKTTFLHRLVCHTQALNIWGYVLNLDPAVMTLLFGANIDIRDTVWYKEVMKQYNLGPSDGILTSHNLFATKFDEVILVIEKRADQLDYVLVDTLGQIEIFTWSVSGKIIIEAFASTFPTVVTYVVDTPRSANPNIFMSNMLYACSILYKTRLPLVLAFNKIDLAQHQFAFEWMEDFEVFHAALDSDHSYSSTLTRSLSLAFEEFYKNIQYVGVSAVKGDGMEAFFKAIKASAKEYMETYKADLDKRREEKQRLEEERIKESMDKLRKDMEKFMGETVVLSTALKDRKWSSSKMMDEEEKRTVGKVPLFMNVHDFVKMREKVCMEVKVKNGDSLKTILTAKKVRVYVCVIRIIFEHNVRRQAIRDVELLKSNGNAIVIFGAHFSYLWSEYGSTFAAARILASLASLKFLIESGGHYFYIQLLMT